VHRGTRRIRESILTKRRSNACGEDCTEEPTSIRFHHALRCAAVASGALTIYDGGASGTKCLGKETQKRASPGTLMG
jgi:hypothetical protein